MNLLVGLVLLLCLICSEFRAGQPAEHVWTRIVLVALISALVPSMAWFQTLIVSKKITQQPPTPQRLNATLRQLSNYHGAVWACASLAIIWAVRWHDVVRENWNLDRWPVIDEALILAPVIISLAASWWIFYATQNHNNLTLPRMCWSDFRQRLAYVSIRLRIHVLLMLIPISIIVLARDSQATLASYSTAQFASVYILFGLLFMAGFPFLLLLVWKNQPIEDQTLRKVLHRILVQHHVKIASIRVWNTGNQVANALVAGVLPLFRVMLISDRLMRQFTNREITAILRHEIGHIRLWHLPTRIGFLVLPLLAFAIDEQNPHGVLARVESFLTDYNFPIGSGFALIVGGYLVYLLLSMPWLCRQMEIEADLYACQPLFSPPDRANSQAQHQQATDLADALTRLAATAPTQAARRTLFHPSLEQRIRLIHQAQRSPEKTSDFVRAIGRRRMIILTVLLVACGLIVWI